jgi:hypothetical protein
MVLDSKIELVRLHFGIATLDDWRDISPAWILGLKGIGQATLDHIRLYLAGHNIALRGDQTADFWRAHLGSARICHQMADEDRFDVVGFTVVVDTREQHPFTFQGLTGDASSESRPLIVPTRPGTLESGDYSVEGLEHAVAVERKSLADLYGTIGAGRDRFVRELERLDRMEFAAVVIEGGWPSIIGNPPPQSKITPKIVYRSIIAWGQRFPRVHWWPCPTRTFAERTTFRILQRFWTDTYEGKRDTSKPERDNIAIESTVSAEVESDSGDNSLAEFGEFF